MTFKPKIKICNKRRTIWDAKVFNKKQSETFLHFDSHSSSISSHMKFKSSSRCRNNNGKCHKEGRHFSSTAPNDESQDPGDPEVPLVLVLVLVLARVLAVLDRQLCGDKFLGARQSWPKRMWIWPTPIQTPMAMATATGVASRAASKMDTMASIEGPQRPETDGKPPRRMQRAFAKGCKKA